MKISIIFKYPHDFSGGEVYKVFTDSALALKYFESLVARRECLFSLKEYDIVTQKPLL